MLKVTRRGLFGILAGAASAAVIRSQIGVDTDAAVGTITFPSLPVAGDTVTLNGVSYRVLKGFTPFVNVDPVTWNEIMQKFVGTPDLILVGPKVQQALARA